MLSLLNSSLWLYKIKHGKHNTRVKKSSNFILTLTTAEDRSSLSSVTSSAAGSVTSSPELRSCKEVPMYELAAAGVKL